MWLNIALVAAILHQCCCVDIDCNNMFPETPYGKVTCHQKEIESQSKEVASCNVIDTSNIIWTTTNISGTVSVEFDLMPRSCGYTSYRLDLWIRENVTSANECYNTAFFTLLHSRRTVKILDTTRHNERGSPCGKTAVVTFNYIFSSCYMLEVAAGEVSYLMDIFNYSEPKYIDTDYKKDLLIDKKPRIITQHIPALQELQFSVGYVTGINVAGMDLEIRYHDSYLSRCGEGSKQHWWEMALSTSGQFMCQMKHRLSNKPSCHVESDGIKCTIHNVTTGFYCVMVEMIDDRCERGTVWNNNSNCIYNSEIIEVKPTSPPEAEPLPSRAPFDAILVAVVLAIVLMCVCLLVLFCRRRRRRSLDSGGTRHGGKVTVARTLRILLLYARDCEPFMNMMVTLRQVLKEVTMCEVYDCFDPVATEELCQNKTDWLRTHISSPDVKVVLVENRCAVLQQRALMEHMKVIYKDPTWLDDLFLYGLRVLLEDLQTNVYERVFVVRIHGFTEEDDNLCHITPYTRYVIPQNTEKLLSSLYQESALEHIIILEDGDSSVQRLQDNIRMLQVFKQQNGDYLSKLLEMVTKECVEKTELEV